MCVYIYIYIYQTTDQSLKIYHYKILYCSYWIRIYKKGNMWIFSRQAQGQKISWNRTISEPSFHKYTNTLSTSSIFIISLWLSGAQASFNKSLCSLEEVSSKLWWHYQQSAWLSGLAWGFCSHICPCGRTVPWGVFFQNTFTATPKLEQNNLWTIFSQLHNTQTPYQAAASLL